MTAGRIYPVPVKPASDITSWEGWPDDAQLTLRAWNRQGRLTFWTCGVFKCWRCGLFCAGRMAGHLAPSRSAAKRHFFQSKAPHCDDCLIALAREVAA